MRIRRDTNRDGELINISSLLDVMFILIIFFLATTTFQQEERDQKVNLPDSADGQTTLSASSSVIVINVRDDGTYLLGNRVMELPDLQEELIAAVKKSDQQKVLVRGDQHALHGMVAAAMLACKRSGIHEAHIGYELPQQ